MKYFKVLGIVAIFCFSIAETLAQTVIYEHLTLNPDGINTTLRTLRTNTFSNRTTNGVNNGVEPKTWTINVENSGWYSKFYDAKTISNGSISAGSALLNSAAGSSGANFTNADIGKIIHLSGAGTGGTMLITTIVGVNSTTQAVLATNSLTTKTNVVFSYGTMQKPGYSEGHYTTYGYNNFEINYRLLSPVAYNPLENYKYPLIVMMHGAGESGDCQGGCNTATNIRYRNNDLNLKHGGLPHLEAIYNPTTGSNGKKAEDPTLNPRAFPGFVVFPQNENGWSGSTQYEQVYRIVELLIGAYNIDPDRIYIHGLSNGAAGVWEVVRARPDLFAALLPMSATISHSAEIFTTEISKATPIPAWIFQGGVDTSPSPNNTNQVVSKLKAAGAIPIYTIYPTLGHATWNDAYAEPKFFSWMLKQNKRNITILYGDSTLCATDNSGVTLALGTGFLAYQWELDGLIIPGATSSTYTATVAGRYRARFSRTAGVWNTWSKPVNIRETPAITPTITAVGTSHLPDINGGNIVRINGPTTKDLTKNWYVNGLPNTTNTNFPPSNLDTANYTLRTTAGVVTLKTIPLNQCSSLTSNSIYVTTGTPTDLVVPAAPSAIALSSSSVQLFWTDNTPDETGFEIFRSTNAAGPYTFFKLLSEGTISYTDIGLLPNTTYYYQLRAVNNIKVSLYTGNVIVTTSIDTTPPTAPQNLILGTGAKSLNSIALSWTASTDNTGVSSYNIYNNGSTLVASNITTTSYTVTGLTANSNYLFTVKAKDAIGNLSQPSNQLFATTVFTGLNYSYSAVNVTTLTNSANNWATPEITGTCSNFDISLRGQEDFFNFKFEGYISLQAGTYNFRTQSDDGSALYIGADNAVASPFNPASPGTGMSYNNDGLHACSPSAATLPTFTFNGTASKPITVIMFEQRGLECLIVEYKLAASSTWLTVPNSALTSGTAPTLTPPSPPTLLTATSAGMSSMNLSWTAASGADAYEIYRSVGNPLTSTYSIVATAAATTSFTDMGLTPSTTYNYKLKSVSNTNGSSTSFSNIDSKATDPDTQGPSPAPSNVVVVSSNYTNASFRWDANSTDNVGVVGYKIYADGNLLGTSTTTTFYTTALQPATSYNITVKAYDISNNESDPSTVAVCNTSLPNTFYSVGANLTVLSSWNSQSNGTGSVPPSFSYNGQYFIIQGNQTLSSPLIIGGNISRVIVADGVTLDISQPLTGTLRVGNGSTVNVNVDYQPVFETVAANSTVNFNSSTTTIPVATYGNLVVNGSSLKNVGSGTLQVLGNLTLGNGVGIKGAPSNTSTISVAGDLITGTTILQPASDNRVTLQFAGSGAHAITGINNQSFYKLAADANATVTFNNTSGSPKSLNLGSTNGGGIDLANGSSLILGTNNLVLTDKAAVNPTNNTGAISINTGNIQITTTANSDANFYFAASPNNRVTNFTMQETGSGTIQIRQPMEVYDGLKINGGTLTANGNVTLKSSATASAAIQQIVNGNITGNVIVERYMSPKRVYRYIASPVAGIKVADWQNYFPITGSFGGANTGTGLGSGASMFIYNETLGLGQLGYAAYPTTDNQAAIVPGRGYAAFIREGTNPTTLINTGVPTQGNFSFTLTGGGAQSGDGWNLIGNPYASDIVWSNTGWSSNGGVSNIIYVRENLVGGGVQWRTWDRSSSTGNLPNGQIPAGQAFWVQTSIASPILTVTEAAKSTLSASNNNNFFRSGNAAPTNLFSISIDNGTYQDYAYVKLTEDGSDNYNKLKDGFKNKNSFFNISTASADKVDLAVNDLNNSFCDKTIAINLATFSPGSYTLQFNNLDNFSLANIQLIDSLTLTTTNLTSSNPQYAITVSADVASYTNRLFLKLTRPSLLTNNAVLSDKDLYCRSEQNAIVSIQNSQVGVNYEAINASSVSLSEKVIGNGETIQLLVPIKNLLANQPIQVRSYFTGCSAVNLANSKIITISELPSITAPSEVAGCIGGTVTISATGTGKTYQWFYENANQTLSETGSSMQISATNPINSYRVTAISDKGCKSEAKNFLVRADSLEIPKIMLGTDGVLETDGTRGVQWLLNEGIIPGANGGQYKPKQSGSYSVSTKNVYCVQKSPAIDYIVTRIEGNGIENFTLAVYPNPAERGGKFTVTGSSPINNQLQLMLTDLVGKELMTEELSLEEYSKGVAIETNLPGGIYIVRVTQDGKSVHQKIVIR